MNWEGEWFNPSIRKTFKYVASCSHMDEWETADWKARVTATGKVFDENDVEIEDDHAVHTVIATDTDVNSVQVEEAFRGDLARGCSCEHDCCGHYHGGLYRVIQLHEHDKKHWLLIASYGRNY